MNNKSNNNEKNKKDDNSIRIFKINDNQVKKKENKKIEEEEVFVRSNSYKISYYSDRNILEESEPDM